MDIYIDKANLKSFLNCQKNDEFDDCLRMLCRQLHIIYNIGKSEIKNDIELAPWILKISEGRGKSEERDAFLADKFPIRPIKSNSYNEWTRRHFLSAYLIDDLDISKLKNRGCVLLGDVGEELEILTKLFCGNDYEYHHLYDLRKNFLSWEQLSNDNQTLPCTDIIINDRYLFENQEEIVQYNLGRMLAALANNVKNRIDVVLFTIYESLYNFGVEKANKIIKHTLEKITGMKPNITFVCSYRPKKDKVSNDRSFVKIPIPHDRFVITNYRLLRSGDSFLYFNTKGERITKGGSLDVDSLANHETYVFVETLLEELQTTYNKIQLQYNGRTVFGDKKSKFIRMV